MLPSSRPISFEAFSVERGVSNFRSAVIVLHFASRCVNLWLEQIYLVRCANLFQLRIWSEEWPFFFILNSMRILLICDYGDGELHGVSIALIWIYTLIPRYPTIFFTLNGNTILLAISINPPKLLQISAEMAISSAEEMHFVNFVWSHFGNDDFKFYSLRDSVA